MIYSKLWLDYNLVSILFGSGKIIEILCRNLRMSNSYVNFSVERSDDNTLEQRT